MIPLNDHNIAVSADAKSVAKDIISTLHDASVNLNTGEIAFWLNIPVYSDRVAIAIYVHDMIDTHDFVSTEQTLADITSMMPVGFMTSTNITSKPMKISSHATQKNTK